MITYCKCITALLLFFNHMSPNWPDWWFATYRILMVKYQNITEFKIITNQAQSHLMSTLNRFLLRSTRKVQNCHCTLQDNRFVLIKKKAFSRCRAPYINRVEDIQMDQKIRRHQSHKVQKAHIFDLGTKMAQMSGTGIPEPCTDCQA